MLKELRQDHTNLEKTTLPQQIKATRAEVMRMVGPNNQAVERLKNKFVTINSLYTTQESFRRDIKQLQNGEGTKPGNAAIRHVMEQLDLQSDRAQAAASLTQERNDRSARATMLVDTSADVPGPSQPADGDILSIEETPVVLPTPALPAPPIAPPPSAAPPAATTPAAAPPTATPPDHPEDPGLQPPPATPPSQEQNDEETEEEILQRQVQ